MQQHLGQSADEDRPAEDEDGGIEIGRCEQRHEDEGQVEQYGRERRDRKAAPGVEHTAGKGHQCHEEDVGEGDAGQLDGQFELPGIGREAGGRGVNDGRCGQGAEDGDDQHRQPEGAGHMVDEALGFLVSPFVLVLGEDGNEGLGESALGEHPAQQVGQPEGHHEGVHLDAGAKGPGLHEVAYKPQDARQQGHAADRGEGAEEVHRGHGVGGVARAKTVDVSGLWRLAAMRFSAFGGVWAGPGARRRGGWGKMEKIFASST